MFNMAWQPEKAVPVYERAVELLPGAAEHRHAWVLEGLSAAYRHVGRPPEAAALLVRVEALARRTADDFVLGYVLLGCSGLAYDKGRFDEAIETAEAALPGFERVRHGSGIAYVHEAVGIAHRAAGRYAESDAELAVAVARFERLGDRARAGRSRFYRAETLLDAGRPDEARAEWARAEGVVGTTPPPEVRHSRERLIRKLGAPSGRYADAGEVPDGAREADPDERGEEQATGPGQRPAG
ncbi:MAG: hypothetical protein AUI10_02335 [Actinobacteria bacterium 13_2_20CM_2_72_6]|nr:MAG: hypothetical protein AUI10_02335 [Actinobacteria bacterium 13_2_20CM_2_72_6]